MDVQMPTMDGLECTRRLRAWEAARHQPRHQLVVGLSANSEPNDIFLAKKSGMDDFLAKPVRLATLEALLIRHIDPASPVTASRAVASRRRLAKRDVYLLTFIFSISSIDFIFSPM